MVVRGVLQVANCALVYYAVGYGAAVLLIRHPRAAKLVGILSGTVMIALGAGLVIEKIVVMVV